MKPWLTRTSAQMTRGRSEPPPTSDIASFVVVTGLSGAGKSTAIHALEDLGYRCVDNLPAALIPTLADVALAEEHDNPIAVLVDARDRSFFREFPGVYKTLRARQDLAVWLIFLEASDQALVRRFSETRRPHPLAPTGSVIEGILREREQLARVKKMSDRVLDTSDLTVHELRRAFRELFEQDGTRTRMLVTLLSFGFKHGLPLDLDLLNDARFLKNNPHHVPALRKLTGMDRKIQDYVNSDEDTEPYLEYLIPKLQFLIPRYKAEGKSYLTIGIGCTGGRHRSVVLAERLKTALSGIPEIRLRVRHRDIEKTKPGQ